MFTDPQKKKREFKKRIQYASASYGRIAYDYKLDRQIRSFLISSQEKSFELERSLKSITRWNYTDIEREVEDYEAYCRDVVEAFKWFFARYGDLKYERLNQMLIRHVNPQFARLPEETKRKNTNEIYRIAGRYYLRMLENFQVTEENPMYFQNVLCPTLESEAKQEAETYLQNVFNEIENKKKRQEEHEYKVAKAQKKVEVDAKISTIEKNYKLQLEELQRNFEYQLQRTKEEFENKLESELEKKYQQDKPKLMQKWKNELLQQQSILIEEEVSKRLKKQFKETINRKDSINQETINLNALKYEQTIKKIEAEYQEYIKKQEVEYEDVVSKLNNKINFLDDHLKETIMNYEELFKEKYEAEIDRRAKILAKEYLQRDFPFE